MSFFFYFIVRHFFISLYCSWQKNKKKLVKIYPEEKLKTKKRCFLIKLEEKIGKSPFNSLCSDYKIFINKHQCDLGRFHCEEFALATFFHTTLAKLEQNKKFRIKSFVSSMETETSISTKPTANVIIFVDKLSHKTMENKMCLIYCLGNFSYHVMALEIRKNGFYIYNSWENSFSNSWFSGLTNKTEFSLRPRYRNVFQEYRARYGLGKCLSKKDLENSLIDVSDIVQDDPYNKRQIVFEFHCKDLNDEFKTLKY
jgi:hypothetical protein